MGQSLTSLQIHLVFSTKNRAAWITPEFETGLYKYLAGIGRNLGSPILASGGTSDHVHLLVSLSKTLALSASIEDLNADSSKWMKTQSPKLKSFAWQDGYGAFSIGESGVPALKRYIASQKEHHRKVSFQDELRQILRKYRIEFDERYLWR